jgi:AcrR family transcriptional regulator
VVAEDTRNRLLDGAWELVAEHGLEQLTLAAVAQRAGVSRQAVYLHFGNRATLLVEMARRIDRSSGFLGEVAAARSQSPVPALRALLDAWFAYLPTILPVARALEAAAITGSEGAEAYTDRMEDWREGLRLAVERVHGSGGLSERWDVEAATDWLWALVHPTAFHHLVHERGWRAEAMRARTLDVVERELLRTVSRRRGSGR